MKGSTVLSENILMGMSAVISFILIILVVRMVLTQQTERTYQNLFESIARDISLIIDRQASMSSSEKREYELPKGVHADVRIDYKYVFVTYDDKTVSKSYSGITNSPQAYEFSEPRILCFVKNQNTIQVFDKPCMEVQ